MLWPEAPQSHSAAAGCKGTMSCQQALGPLQHSQASSPPVWTLPCQPTDSTLPKSGQGLAWGRSSSYCSAKDIAAALLVMGDLVMAGGRRLIPIAATLWCLVNLLSMWPESLSRRGIERFFL